MTRQDATAGSSAIRVVDESVGLTPEDVSSSAAAIASAFSRDTSAAGVCVADGMGVRIIVDRGALEVHDGLGPHRRTRRFDRATHRLRRLVIIGSTGLVTLDALNWCRRLGIGVLVLAPDGTAAFASTPRMTDDARLRRIQVQAPDLPVGLDLARWSDRRQARRAGQGAHRLLRRPRRGLDRGRPCRRACDPSRRHRGRARDRGRRRVGLLAGVGGRSECVPMFAAKDRTRIPAHWTRYEGRRSVLASGNGNRKAERPVNGIDNYLYALAEAEAVLACQAVGLDPGLGIVHNDTKGRQSLALDLIEPVRPQVDAFVLDLLERRTFRKVEFTETADGHCRLKAPLTHELAETIPRWAQALAPIAGACGACARSGHGRQVRAGDPFDRDQPSPGPGGREGPQVGDPRGGQIDDFPSAGFREAGGALELS